MPTIPTHLESWLRRTVLPTTRDTAALRQFGQAALNQSVFSATNDYADFLGMVRQQVTSILEGKQSPENATLLLGQMIEVLEYAPPAGKENTIQDLSSWARIKLVVETNVASARGYGQYVSGLKPEVLGSFPAWRVVTGRRAVVPRDWPERWTVSCRAAHEAKGLDVYRKTGQMVALKSSRVWTQLGNPALWPDALGNPWPPFFFNSGKVTEEVSFGAASKMGFEIPKRKTIEAKPFQASGGISTKLPPDVAKAVRANLESQGFKIHRDGSFTPPPEDTSRIPNEDMALFNRVEEAIAA